MTIRPVVPVHLLSKCFLLAYLNYGLRQLHMIW